MTKNDKENEKSNRKIKTINNTCTNITNQGKETIIYDEISETDNEDPAVEEEIEEVNEKIYLVDKIIDLTKIARDNTKEIEEIKDKIKKEKKTEQVLEKK